MLFSFQQIVASLVAALLGSHATLPRFVVMKARGVIDAVVVEVHYSSLLRFEIFILHRQCCVWNGLSIVEVHKGIFCLKSQ